MSVLKFGLMISIAVLLSGCAKFNQGKRTQSKCTDPAICQNKDWQALRGLIESIPKLHEDDQPSRDTIIPDSSRMEHGFNKGEPSYEFSEVHESVSTFEQLVAFDPNSDVLWPGSVIQGRSLKSGILTPVPLKHSPAEITITNLTMPKGVNSSTIVQRPSQASVNEAIQGIVNQDTDTVASAKATVVIKELYSLEQGLNQVGISGKWIGGEARALLDSRTLSKKNNFIVKFTQSYYTAAFEPPKNPETIFSLETRAVDAAPFMYQEDLYSKRESNPPMYISSVSYGRAMIFIFSSDVDSQKMRTTLEAVFNGSLIESGLNAEAEHYALLQSFETKVLVLGGGGQAMARLITGNKLKAINEWIREGANFTRKSPGVPIAYTARYLKDYDIAKLTFTTQYEVHQTRPIPIKNFEITFNTLDDDKDVEEAVDVWLTKEGEVLFQGAFGANEKWSDGEIKKFIVPVQTQLGLNSCQGMKLRIRKRPNGSERGCGWNMALDLNVKLEHERTYKTLRQSDQEPKRWGDDSDYDRTFILECR